MLVREGCLACQLGLVVCVMLYETSGMAGMRDGAEGFDGETIKSALQAFDVTAVFENSSMVRGPADGVSEVGSSQMKPQI